MIRPSTINSGDKIGIITPASVVKSEYIKQACEFLSGKGFQPVVMPYAEGPADGSFASTPEHRLSDFIAAWEDPEIKAVVCGRGGYGATHLLPHIPDNLLSQNPKWLIGFSDISALHALSISQGVESIHGPMCRHFTDDDPGVKVIMDILTTNRMPTYYFERDNDFNVDLLPLNHCGEGEGMLIGGNVAVLNGLAATPFDLLAKALNKDCILFIEDVAEPIYKIERVLYRLLMQGVFSHLKGLLVGQFTEYKPSADHVSMESMIEKFLKKNNLNHFPVGYGFPAGHVTPNYPLVEGAHTRLVTTPNSIQLNQF